MLPTFKLARGAFDLAAELEGLNCFAAIVLDGMLSYRFRLADQTALRLIGPGEVISRTTQERTMLIDGTDCRVLETALVALLGDEFLAGVRRWPQLLPGLNACFAEQNERLVAQLAICQLPRVDQRLMAMMWLLAESWGRVTPAGTSLPLSLTHDVLGGLVGARRSTVTLALGDLSARGSLIRQAGGWLLVEPAPTSNGQLADFEEPRIVGWPRSRWQREEPETSQPSRTAAELYATVERLRAEHLRNRAQVRRNLERIRLSRARLSRRQTPS